MTGLHGVSLVADHIRRAGWHYLFGQELDAAKFRHWVTQWYPGWLVDTIQWEAVAELVAYARDASPFYRARLADLDVGPDLTPEAFRSIQPLSRQDVVSASAAIRVPSARAGRLRRHSGGSSGRGVEIPLTMPTYCWYLAGTWRGLRWWGTDFSDPGVVLLGSGSSGLQSLAVRAKDWVMNWLRVPVDDHLSARASEALYRLAAFGPAFLYGYPSAVHQLARAAASQGWQPRRQLKVIVLTGEPVHAFQRHAIEETFQCPVAEEYGNGELGSMAFQCPKGNLHVNAESVFLESVGTQSRMNGAGAPILATQLRNRLFPLIRYETGDIGALDDANCPCKRGLPTIRVLGRTKDQLLSAGGMTLARPFVERLHRELPDALQGRVQIVHTRPGSIVLRVERGADGHVGLSRAAAAGAAVFGHEWHIGVVEVERLARQPSGKLPYFLRLGT